MIDSLRYTVQDPDDAHVVAAAKQERCDIIVTENIRDFNRAALVEHRMNLATSDEFMTELFEGKETKAIVYGGLLDMWARLRERPTVPQFLERLWGRDRLYGFIQGLTADVTQNVGVSRDRIDQRALQTRIRQIEQGIGI
ncbi:MAG TPA: PIN domain-containing protein [Candidatus Dormibacteraeota bacterium]|nr:PIN domain-containing protein [Candidatus Dormibacteraeota bacterium]